MSPAHVGGTPDYRPPIPVSLLRSGMYSASGEPTGSGQAMTQSLLIARPIIFDKSGTIDQVLINLTAVAASSVVRLGLYADDGSFYPGALLADWGVSPGTIDTSVTTGTRTITVSQAVKALTPYWHAIVAQGGAPSVGGDNRVFGNIPTAAQAMTAINKGYTQAAVTGALPANFTTSKTDNTGLGFFVKFRAA